MNVAARDHSRKIDRVERNLSLSVIAVLLLTFLLVFAAKWGVDMPSDALVADDATAAQFALAISLDVDVDKL